MTAVDRTHTEVARWIDSTQHGAPVEIHVHHHAPARTSAWSTLTPEWRAASAMIAATAVMAFLSLFALAGGAGATALFVGLILGAFLAVTAVMVLAARSWR